MNVQYKASLSQHRDKNDMKQYVTKKVVIFVLVGLMLLFAMLLPVGFLFKDHEFFIPCGFLGTWYNSAGRTEIVEEKDIQDGDDGVQLELQHLSHHKIASIIKNAEDNDEPMEDEHGTPIFLHEQMDNDMIKKSPDELHKHFLYPTVPSYPREMNIIQTTTETMNQPSQSDYINSVDDKLINDRKDRKKKRRNSIPPKPSLFPRTTPATSKESLQKFIKEQFYKYIKLQLSPFMQKFDEFSNITINSTKHHRFVIDRVFAEEIDEVLSKFDYARLQSIVKHIRDSRTDVSKNDLIQRFYTQDGVERKYDYIDKINAESIDNDAINKENNFLRKNTKRTMLEDMNYENKDKIEGNITNQTANSTAHHREKRSLREEIEELEFERYFETNNAHGDIHSKLHGHRVVRGMRDLMVGKAKEYLKKHIEKYINDFDFNPEKWQAYLRTKYKEYEDCMKGKDAKYYEKMAIKPKIFTVGEKQAFRVFCDMCHRPDQEISKWKLDWKRFKRHSTNASWETLPKHTDGYDMDTDTGNLYMDELIWEDSGIYICFLNDKIYQSVIWVDVLPSEDEKTRQVFDPKAVPHPKYTPARPVHLQSLGLWLLTEWNEWSKCSQCGVRGYRTRYGMCKIRTEQKGNETMMFPIFSEFPDGIPCRSSLIPPKLASVKSVQNRQSERQVGYCHEKCPDEENIASVTDKNGNPVEIIKRPADMTDLSKQQQKIPQTVVRRVFYVKFGRKCALKCPHLREGDSVRWKNGSQVLDPVKMAGSNKRRVFVDEEARVLIRKLTMWDSGLYLCYVKGILRGSLKLKVKPPHPEGLRGDWPTTVGIVGTLLLVLYIAIMLIRQEKKYGKVMM